MDEADGVSGTDGRVAQGLGEKTLAGASRSHQSTSGGCSCLGGNSHGNTASLSAPFSYPAASLATRHDNTRRHRSDSTTNTRHQRRRRCYRPNHQLSVPSTNHRISKPAGTPSPTLPTPSRTQRHRSQSRSRWWLFAFHRSPTNWAKEIRHFHKHGWKLPIPRYDGDDPLHVRLSELGKAAEQECAALIAESDIMSQPAGDAQSRAARRLLRHEWQPVSETARMIESSVAVLLSDPGQVALAERQMATKGNLANSDTLRG